MAKELPYFKFEPNQWENGNIQMCSREEKGLFIDLCSMYWSRLGDMPLKLAVQKLCAGNATALRSLCDQKIFEIIDDHICIDFLNEQLLSFNDVSKQNSQNAKEGWVKRREKKILSGRNAIASNPQSESDAIREEEIREEKKKEEKETKKKVVFTPPVYEEFLDYALKVKSNLKEESVKLKFMAWKEAGWVDGNEKKINNWKSKLLNTIPHLQVIETKKRRVAL